MTPEEAGQSEAPTPTEATRHFILGTAGHIDHGKTLLIQALTGTNTDRLPEEKRRGMTIESKWPKRLKLPGLEFYRMTKNLG